MMSALVGLFNAKISWFFSCSYMFGLSKTAGFMMTKKLKLFELQVVQNPIEIPCIKRENIAYIDKLLLIQ